MNNIPKIYIPNIPKKNNNKVYSKLRPKRVHISKVHRSQGSMTFGV